MSTGTTRPDPDNRPGLLLFLLAVAVSAVALVAGQHLAKKHFNEVRAQQRLEAIEQARQVSEERGALFVARADGPLPVSDPGSELWAQAAVLEIALQRQNVAMPMLDEVTIPAVRLQGLTDGESIAWRISWRDGTTDGNVDTGRFSDAVALQFPITTNAKYSMGDDGQLVQILHWKALWQKDIDEHFQDVQDLHPNYWADLYWFAEGRPYDVPDSFSDPRSHAWFAAYSAGNPVADIYRSVAVEELSAEGYGSLTSQTESVSVGRGEWADGEWAVVLARPLRTDDPLDYQFWRGGRGQVGVAVWDGNVGNVGGRKHWTNWVEFVVSP